MKINAKTKATILLSLKSRLKKSRIENIFVFTAEQWKSREAALINQIASLFGPKKVIIRSSAVNEDTGKCSMAGYYDSVLGVDSNNGSAIKKATEKVLLSYNKGNSKNKNNEVFVQPQLEDIKMSGVVLTRQIENGAPYYVINYDEKTGRTDSVTSGRAGSVIYISHFTKRPFREKWKKLLIAVKEIESLFGTVALDIEFAVKRDGEIVIFQVRPLIASARPSYSEDKTVSSILADIKDKFCRSNKRVPHLYGNRTIFGDMPDWNPAEIIGDRPNTLAYSLYSYIITDEVWHRARTSLSYANVFPGELMVSFGKKPYMDTRLSFNSFVPASLSPAIKEKLINYYLDKLAKHPEAQDKVEFEILWTCYDFTLKDRIAQLRSHGFTDKEIDTIVECLRELTNSVLTGWRKIIKNDILSTDELTKRRDKVMEDINAVKRPSLWEILTAAHYIFQNCKEFGTFGFSRLARLAFISKSMLLSMVTNGTIGTSFYYEFLKSIETIATKVSKDASLLRLRKITLETFLDKYGHLRLGTYDITAPTYREIIELISREAGVDKNSCLCNRKEYRLDMALKQKINRQLKIHRLDIDAQDFLDFLKGSISAREVSKFEFTKSLNTSLELIGEAGKCLGFSREQMKHVDYPTLMKFRNPEYSDLKYAKKVIGESIKRHSRERAWCDRLILPAVITSADDLDYVTSYQARPNFITQKAVKGRLLFLNKDNFTAAQSYENKIVIIENADPGYDWIFSKRPLGLVTRYGGVASHMSIRCAEFSLPAAIGCGEIIYKNLLNAKGILLDCKNRKIDIF